MSKNSNSNNQRKNTKSIDDAIRLAMILAKPGGFEKYRQHQEELKEESRRKDIEKIVQNQTAFLRFRVKSLEDSKKATIFYFLTENGFCLWFENRKKDILSFSGNPSKYLIRIIADSNEKKSTPIKSLIKIGTYKTNSNVSKTISGINTRFRKVCPTEDLIGNETGKSGYALNKRFSFKLIS